MSQTPAFLKKPPLHPKLKGGKALRNEGYAAEWERFWGDLPAGEPPVWETDPIHAAERDVKTMAAHADMSLPLVDVGCGTGTQTRAFARHLSRVLGVDFSPAAVNRARSGPQAGEPGRLGFLQLDLRSRAQVDDLAGEIAPCNLYMRSVLHQMPPDDRVTALQAAGQLLGPGGVLMSVELTPEVAKLRRHFVERPEGPPPRMARTERYNLAVADWDDGELPGLPERGGLRVLERGDTVMVMSETIDGSPVRLPMLYQLCCS